MDIEKEIKGYSAEDYEPIQDKAKQLIDQKGIIEIELKDGTIIENVRSVQTWGEGLFYSSLVDPEILYNSVNALRIKDVR